MERQRAINLLNETFNSDFDVKRFAVFTKELFNNFNVNVKSWSVWKEYLDYIESYQLLGSYTQNREVIDVLVVKLKKSSSRDRARTMQRNFVAKYLSNANKNAALIAFYGDDPQDWRFSFVKMEYNLIKDESGKVVISKELTPAKRYSFLVGVNEPNHTCRSQFLKLVMEEDMNPSLLDIENAFSIDNVTKEFFNEYKELFLELEESLSKVIAKDKYVKAEFEDKGISTVDFAKKLLGQIVFIYFLQKKGWLGVVKDADGRFKKWGTGPKNFLRRLFDKEIAHYDNFFNEVLEPLFYEALATERDDDYYSRFKCKIPFLNGGLFEPINDYDWAGTEIILDNHVFDRILSTFDRFNFTVKEDEPLEKEVAVDPEMLGKVFENLLEVKDRKSKGAFYTPREIVHYMCQQSLINYLETNTSISRKDIEKFIQLGDLALDMIIKEQEQVKKYGKSYDIKEEFSLPKSIKENYKEIDKLLKEIKIVDPAVGSGAFPVGMMNEIVKARSILSIYYNEKRSDYDLKREIIENCLYGVDIESSAVDITKLRFWLSLIVDEVDMHNIKPLPNLDHKIMCGNSLLEEFEGVKLFDEKLLGEVKKDVFFEVKAIEKEIAELYKKKGDIVRGKTNGSSIKEVEKEIKKLERKKDKILSAPKQSSRNLTLDEATQHRIKESQKKLSELKGLQKQFFNEQNRKIKKQLREQIDKIEWELIEKTLKEQGNENAMQKLAQYKKNKAKPFFLWKLYFAEVFQRENPGFDVVIANPPYGQILSEEDKKTLRTHYPEIKFKVDIYPIFILLTRLILRKSGYITYIIPNTLLDNYYLDTVRSVLITQYKLDFLIDLDDHVFESAVVHSMVFGATFNMSDKDYDIKVKIDGTLNSKIEKIPASYFKTQDYCCYDLRSFKYNSIISKLNLDSEPFNEVIDLKQTIKTGNDPKYITQTKENKNFKPILRGKDINKYYKKWAGLYVNYGKHLANPIRSDIFEQPKILIREAGKEIIATYDDENYFIMSSLYNGILKSKKYSLKYLLALLNSNIFQFLMSLNTFDKTKGAFTKARIYHYYKLPIKKISLDSQKRFIEKVDNIISITSEKDYRDNVDKQQKVKRLLKEINLLVYDLYQLSTEEIKTIEGYLGSK